MVNKKYVITDHEMLSEEVNRVNYMNEPLAIGLGVDFTKH